MFYLGEDFTVEFNVGSDITGSTAQIKYKAPGGVITAQTATITNAAGGVFSYDVPNSELSVAGKYKFWYKLTLSGGTIAIGEPEDVLVYEEGKSGL